jgi:PleD family two-component response regulator
VESQGVFQAAESKLLSISARGMKMTADQTKVVEIDFFTVEREVAAAEAGETVVLTRDGRPVVAMMDIDVLTGLKNERDLLRRLALGELESAGGEGEELEAVLEDCRLVLEEN